MALHALASIRPLTTDQFSNTFSRGWTSGKLTKEHVMGKSQAFRRRAVTLARRMFAVALGLTTAEALAAETTTYTYDAKGAVKVVQTTGGVNNGVTHTYQHDKAKNRTQSQTTGSPNSSPPP
jgi:YD repeat-containing protein